MVLAPHETDRRIRSVLRPWTWLSVAFDHDSPTASILEEERDIIVKTAGLSPDGQILNALQPFVFAVFPLPSAAAPNSKKPILEINFSGQETVQETHSAHAVLVQLCDCCRPKQ